MPDQRIDFTLDPPDIAFQEESPASTPPAPTLVWPTADFDAAAAGFVSFGLSLSWQWSSGLGVAPKAGAARQQVAIWRCSSEVSYLIATCVGCRIGAVPIFPAIDLGPNFVLLDREVVSLSPDQTPDGVPVLTAMMRCRYVSQMAQGLGDPIVIPNTVLRLGQLTQLYPADFDSRLIVGLSPPAGFDGNQVTY